MVFDKEAGFHMQHTSQLTPEPGQSVTKITSAIWKVFAK